MDDEEKEFNTMMMEFYEYHRKNGIPDPEHKYPLDNIDILEDLAFDTLHSDEQQWQMRMIALNKRGVSLSDMCVDDLDSVDKLEFMLEHRDTVDDVSLEVYLQGGKVDMLTVLQRRGYDFSKVNPVDMGWAIVFGHTRAVRMCLDAGANITDVPLDYLVEATKKGQHELLSILHDAYGGVALESLLEEAEKDPVPDTMVIISDWIRNE